MRWMGLAFVLAAAACSESDTGGGPQAGAPAASRTGEWVALFDGRNLDAFARVGDANWRIEGETVRADDGAGVLITHESFGDLELEAEFWVDGPANSGVFFRCQDPGNVTDMTCYEANIFDTRPDQTYRTGGIVNVASPSRIMNAAGRWNRYHIRAVGTRLEVELNGESVVAVDDSRFTVGPIALQRGAGTVIFRNVRVRAL